MLHLHTGQEIGMMPHEYGFICMKGSKVFINFYVAKKRVFLRTPLHYYEGNHDICCEISNPAVPGP